MPATVLLIDSDEAHRRKLEYPLAAAGLEVDSITHADAVAHISRVEMNRYACVIVTLTDEPSTLAASHQMGAYVVHYITQLCPEVLPRVIALTALEMVAVSVATRCRVLAEPISPDELIAAVKSEE